MLEPGVGYIMLSDFTHTSSKELYEAIEKLQQAGHEEAPVRPARQPGRRARAGRRRHRRLRAQGRHGRLHARAARPPRRRSTTRPATAPTSTSRSSCSSTAARPRPPRSWPAPSRTTTAGLIVGQRTWGKGLVQSVYTLSYGAGLALTTARYYTPSGRWIQRDYSDLLAYVNPGDPDSVSGAQTGDEAPHGPPRAPSSTPTPAAWSTPRAASRQTSSSRTTGTRSCSSSCWSRYAFFNFAVDWLARHPNVTEDFEVTPGDPRRLLPVRREVGQVLDRRGAQEGLRRRPQPTPSSTSRSGSRSSTRSSAPRPAAGSSSAATPRSRRP